MFNAEDAMKVVAEYYVKGEKQSQEWLVKHTESALEHVHKAAGNGETKCRYKISLEKEEYSLAKRKLLTDAIAKLGFNILVEDTQIVDQIIKKHVVFVIAWGGTAAT